MTERLNKYLASLGIASRREIDQMTEEKRIYINGELANLGDKVGDTDEIIVDGQIINHKKPKKVYILMNKPEGIITTTQDENGRETVIDLLREKDRNKRIFPVGRLDQYTSGLLLLTNDGELANKITHPKNHISKTYLMILDNNPTKGELKNFEDGVRLDDGITSPAEIEYVERTNRGEHVLQATIFEGKNRQIRRMCESLKWRLLALRRIKIGDIELGNLRDGEYKEIAPNELFSLLSLEQE